MEVTELEYELYKEILNYRNKAAEKYNTEAKYYTMPIRNISKFEEIKDKYLCLNCFGMGSFDHLHLFYLCQECNDKGYFDWIETITKKKLAKYDKSSLLFWFGVFVDNRKFLGLEWNKEMKKKFRKIILKQNAFSYLNFDKQRKE